MSLQYCFTAFDFCALDASQMIVSGASLNLTNYFKACKISDYLVIGTACTYSLSVTKS